jgi:hypothetical protein
VKFFFANSSSELTPTNLRSYAISGNSQICEHDELIVGTSERAKVHETRLQCGQFRTRMDCSDVLACYFSRSDSWEILYPIPLY